MEIFLSHATPDRQTAARIAKMLAEHGLKVWFSRTNLRGAQQWHDEIGRALARCNWFLLLLSPDAVRSEWVKRELLYALDDRRYRNHILPVLVRTCQPRRLSFTLGGFQTIDLRRRYDVGCAELLAIWKIKAPEK